MKDHFRGYIARLLTVLLICGLITTASANKGKVMQELEYRDIRVSLDGEILDLRNAIGEKVEPFMFGGTNYLPVRALAESLGLNVAWNGQEVMVVLTTPTAIPESESKVLATLQNVDAMEGLDFEYWTASLLRYIGFSAVEVTRASGDQGVDVTAEKDGIKYAIQCKRYSSNLGNDPVQEVAAGRTMYHAHVGAVITNQYFTSGAKELAESNNVLLWDRDWIETQLKYLEIQGVGADFPTDKPVQEITPTPESASPVEAQESSVREQNSQTSGAGTVVTPAQTTGQKAQATYRTIYVTRTGKKYHYDPHCNGGTYYESTLEEALARGLTACEKCVG